MNQAALNGFGDSLTGPAAAASALAALGLASRVRIRVRRRPRRFNSLTARLATVLGCVAALHGAPASAASFSSSGASLIPQGEDASPPPWAGNDGSPPLRSVIPAPGGSMRTHPVVHGPVSSHGAVTPLFPRAKQEGKTDPRQGSRGKPDPREQDITPRERERRESMSRHPAGSGLLPRCGKDYVVRSGDTLWEIAARALSTEDERRIARYWPSIHRVNRNIIGVDPSVIHPGQRLVLPNECGDSR